MIKTYVYVLVALAVTLFIACGDEDESGKHRILISTDIGGTDPDDNQSMAHLLMYSDMFDIEGLVSSPFGGTGSKKEILRMIDLYEQDFCCKIVAKWREEVLSDWAKRWNWLR